MQVRKPVRDEKLRSADPANTEHWGSDVSMLGQRCRRWANIKTTLPSLLVFARHHLLLQIYKHLTLEALKYFEINQENKQIF